MAGRTFSASHPFRPAPQDAFASIKAQLPSSIRLTWFHPGPRSAPGAEPVNCHCSLCQRAHGAPLVTWVGVAEDSFSLDSTDSLRWYHSSQDSRRGFCQLCGTTVFFQSERWPGEIHIARANIDGDIDREPALHAYWESHASWFEFSDSLSRPTHGD